MADPESITIDSLDCVPVLDGNFTIGDDDMAQNGTIFVSTDTALQVDNLRDRTQKPETFISDASVTAQVTDSAGANVGSAITLAFRQGSNGRYVGKILNSIGLIDGDRYTVTVTAIKGSTKTTFKATVVARFKRAA